MITARRGSSPPLLITSTFRIPGISKSSVNQSSGTRVAEHIAMTDRSWTGKKETK